MPYSLSPEPVQRWWKAAAVGGGLIPAEGYKFKYFDAGTDDEATIYQDADGTPYPTPANTATLNDEGYAIVFLKTGQGYKLVITDEDDATILTLDPLVSGSGASGEGIAFLQSLKSTEQSFDQGEIETDSIGLAAVSTTQNKYCWVGGYWTSGDAPARIFEARESGDADNDGTIIASTFDPSFKWFALPYADAKIRAQDFGVCFSLSAEVTERMQAADVYAASVGSPLVIAYAPNTYIDTMTFTSTSVEVEAGAQIKGIPDGTAEVTFEGLFMALPEIPGVAYPTATKITRFDSVTFPGAQVLYLEWLGGTPNSNTSTPRNSNKTATDLAAASGAGRVVMSYGTWFFNTADSFVMPTTGQIWQLDGLVRNQVPTTLFEKGIYCDAFNFGQDLNVAEDLNVVGDADVGGDAAVVGAITGESIEVTKSAKRGMGNSGLGPFPIPAQILTYHTYAGVTTTGTGDVTMATITLGGASFVPAGGICNFYLSGTMLAGTSVTYTAKLKLDGSDVLTLTFIFSGSFSSQAGYWTLTGCLAMVDSGSGINKLNCDMTLNYGETSVPQYSTRIIGGDSAAFDEGISHSVTLTMATSSAGQTVTCKKAIATFIEPI